MANLLIPSAAKFFILSWELDSRRNMRQCNFLQHKGVSINPQWYQSYAIEMTVYVLCFNMSKSSLRVMILQKLLKNHSESMWLWHIYHDTEWKITLDHCDCDISTVIPNIGVLEHPQSTIEILNLEFLYGSHGLFYNFFNNNT